MFHGRESLLDTLPAHMTEGWRAPLTKSQMIIAGLFALLVILGLGISIAATRRPTKDDNDTDNSD